MSDSSKKKKKNRKSRRKSKTQDWEHGIKEKVEPICEHPTGAIAYQYWNPRTRENVYRCTECGMFFYQ